MDRDGILEYAHKYSELVEKLTTKTQDELRAKFKQMPRTAMETAALEDASLSREDFSFDGVLENSDNAFVSMRYAYEGKLDQPGKGGFTAMRVLWALIELIRERKPDWFKPGFRC
jgi:hypothetical protein